MAGHGGARAGAGRKPKANEPAINPELEKLTPDQLMDLSAKRLAQAGAWDAASKAAARLAASRKATPSSTGKKDQQQAAAQSRASSGSRFAPPPPPKLN